MKFKIYLHTICYVLLLLALGLTTISFIACSGSSKQDTENIVQQQSDSVLPNQNLQLIATLNNKIRETSGLALLNDVLITHNDKGRSNQIMLLNPDNGNLLQMITPDNIQNNDWEDLAQNEKYLFIGDMGNNEGERKNLAIHIIAINDINKNNTEVKSIGSINFTYPDQTEFDVSKKHNFDCEAIICLNNQLYLFTKNRLDDKTNLYVLPTTPGNYTAKYIASFEVGGRITGADISSNGSKVALLGFNKKSDCFIWILKDFEVDNLFSGQNKKQIIGTYAQVGQMEGVAFKNDSTVFISSEEIVNVNARLYLFSLN